MVGPARKVFHLVLSAVNSALEQAKEISNEEMGKLTQGLSIPGLI
ncbi:MAG: YbaB/EbfC family nucleoid-associated protein [Limisphaerales bacterium]